MKTALLLLASVLSAPGDILLSVRSPPITLTAGQRTTLTNGAASQWPAIPAASIISFRAQRARPGATVVCSVEQSETLTASALFALLVAGVTVSPGLAATARSSWTAPVPCDATMLASLGTLVSALSTGATAARTIEFECMRGQAAATRCAVTWAKSYSQAAAFTELQAGSTLAPIGVE